MNAFKVRTATIVLVCPYCDRESYELRPFTITSADEFIYTCPCGMESRKPKRLRTESSRKA